LDIAHAWQSWQNAGLSEFKNIQIIILAGPLTLAGRLKLQEGPCREEK
jgi:hypothetical protein